MMATEDQQAKLEAIIYRLAEGYLDRCVIENGAVMTHDVTVVLRALAGASDRILAKAEAAMRDRTH